MPETKTRKLTITSILLTALLLGLCTTALGADTKSDSDKKRPNILLIIGDDFGVDVTSDMFPGLIDDLQKKYGPSGHNHPDYKSIKGLPASTPRLDRLTKEGMLFTNVWAHPFCSPTRASVLTGLFGKKANVLTYADPLSQNHTSFVQILKDKGGYSTALFGKWHLAGMPSRRKDVPSFPGMKPKEAGFELFKGNLNAAIFSYWKYDYHVQDEKTAPGEWRTETPPEKSLPGIAASNYAPLVKVADAIEWITENEKKNPDKPWFAWVAFNLSHATITRQPSMMAVPNKDTIDQKTIDEMSACGGKFGSNNNGNCSGESLMRAMTNSMDTLTGKLMDAVNEIDPNTYIIYISDNGTPMYRMKDGEFIDNMYITRKGRGKGTAYESGAHVPMVIKGPGIKANSINDAVLHTADLFSTALSLAGLEIPKEVNDSTGKGRVALDSISITPILFNKKSTVRDPNTGYVLTESVNLMTNGTQHVGARNKDYKIVCAGGIESGNCSFYNLEDDPLEEYPLEKPDSCKKYSDRRWTPENPEWNYCRLMEVIKEDSYVESK